MAVDQASWGRDRKAERVHHALGQFLNYRIALESEDPDRTLYLAVPVDTYDSFFTLPFVQISVTRHQVALIVYDPRKQEIRRWINRPSTAVS